MTATGAGDPVRRPVGRLASWVLLCALGEFGGIAAGAIWYGAANVLVGEPSGLAPRLGAWLLMALAAIPETLVLGLAQAAGLRGFMALSTPRWLAATSIVGLLGWGVGAAIPLFLVGPAAPMTQEPELAVQMVFAAIFGAAAGLLFGLSQSLALPAEARRIRTSWVIANVAGWGVGLPLIYLAAQVGAGQSDIPLRVLLWAVGGLAAGLSVGLATGVPLAIFARQRR